MLLDNDKKLFKKMSNNKNQKIKYFWVENI